MTQQLNLLVFDARVRETAMIVHPLIGFLGDQERQEYRDDVRQRFIQGTTPAVESWGQRRKALGDAVCQRKLIYLDTKYWVYFREVEDGTSTCQDDAILLSRLRQLVSQGTAICPFADAAFIELMRQAEPRRSATARIMDELSQGVSLQEQDQRIVAEIHDYLLRALQKTATTTRHSRENVWTRTAFVVGDLLPQITGMASQYLAGFQNGIDATLCSYSLEELMTNFAAIPPDSKLFRLDVHSEQNQNKTLHLDKVKSFKQVFQAELANALDLYSNNISHAFYDLIGLSKEQIGETDINPAKEIIRIAAGTLRKHPDLDILPTLRVAATIHASYWIDKSRKYKNHDAEDIMHAKAALPYCNFFFTERSLASLVSSPPARLSQFFNTCVCSNSRDALEALSGL